MKSPIIPLGDKIVILPQEEGEQQYGNIVVPDMGKDKPEIGIVLAVGPGRISTNGTLIPNKLKVGVTVMVPKFGAQVVTVENETYIVAGESDVLGIIKGKDETYPEFVEKHYKKENNE
tara:strand:- start:3 stop:356 length:354 start_codon:yes stop_codon:yes gene_type:complete